MREIYENSLDGVLCSAISGAGIENLCQKIEEIFNKEDRYLSLALFPQFASASAWLYEHGQVLYSDYDAAGLHSVTVRLSQSDIQRFSRLWPEIKLTKPNPKHSHDTKKKSILITGCSSGIGLDAALRLQEKGWQVLASCQRVRQIARVCAKKA